MATSTKQVSAKTQAANPTKYSVSQINPSMTGGTSSANTGPNAGNKTDIRADGSYTLKTPTNNTPVTTMNGNSYNSGGGLVSTPTTVFSSVSAQKKVNNEIVPELTRATKSISDSNLQKMVSQKTQEANPTKYTVSQIDKNKTGGTMANRQKQVPQEKTPQEKIAEQIANEAEPGNKFVYTKDGTRYQIPFNEPTPSGYSDVKPQNPTQDGLATTNEFYDASGISYKEFEDGTYGVTDKNGNFGSITKSEFDTAMANSPTGKANALEIEMKALADTVKSIASGAMPLDSVQQAQVDATVSDFDEIIRQQQEDNKNYTGGVSMAMNLSGMGNQISGIGMVKASIDQGVSKVKSLLSDKAKTVAQMTEAFRTNKIKQLSEAYDKYKVLSDGVQKEIDNVSDIVKTNLQSIQTRNSNKLKAEVEIQKSIQEGAKTLWEAGVPSDVVAKVSSSKTLEEMYKNAGKYAPYVPGIMGEYAIYANGERAAGRNPVSPNDFQTIDANRKRSLARAKGGSGGGGGESSRGGGSNKYTSDLDAATGRLSGLITAENQREAFLIDIGKARDDSDKIKSVVSHVLKLSPSTIKEDYINQSSAIANVDKALDALSTGIKTGVLSGTMQGLYNKVGKDYDPNLSKIQQYVTSAIQPYRSSITGAAWGTQEDKEYDELFGSIGYSPTELKQRLEGIKDIMKRKTINSIESQLGGVSIITQSTSQALSQQSAWASNAITSALQQHNTYYATVFDELEKELKQIDSSEITDTELLQYAYARGKFKSTNDPYGLFTK